VAVGQKAGKTSVLIMAEGGVPERDVLRVAAAATSGALLPLHLAVLDKE